MHSRLEIYRNKKLNYRIPFQIIRICFISEGHMFAN